MSDYPVRLLSPEKLVIEFVSELAAARYLGITEAGVRNLRHTHRHHVKGWKNVPAADKRKTQFKLGSRAQSYQYPEQRRSTNP